MNEETTRLAAAWQSAAETNHAASRHEAETRRAAETAKKALQDALIAEGGWHEGQQIALADGGTAWISYFSFHGYGATSALRATCYRLLKSGKRSVRPDLSVVLIRIGEEVQS